MTNIKPLDQFISELLKIGIIRDLSWHIDTRIVLVTYIQYKLKNHGRSN